MSERLFEYSKMHALRNMGRETNSYCVPISLHEIDHIVNATPIPKPDEVRSLYKTLGIRGKEPGGVSPEYFLEDLQIYARNLELEILQITIAAVFAKMCPVPKNLQVITRIVDKEATVITPNLQVLHKGGNLHAEINYQDYYFIQRISSYINNGYRPVMAIALSPEQ